MPVYEVILKEPRGNFTSWSVEMPVYEVILKEPRGNFTSWRDEMPVYEVIPEDHEEILLHGASKCLSMK